MRNGDWLMRGEAGNPADFIARNKKPFAVAANGSEATADESHTRTNARMPTHTKQALASQYNSVKARGLFGLAGVGCECFI